MRRLDRNIAIVGSVVLFHVAALWALHAGLLRRVVEVVVPIQVLSEFITPPAPKAEPLPAPPPPPEPPKEPVPRKVERVAAPAPQPAAIADPTPEESAPTGSRVPQLATPVTPQVPAAASAPAVPPKVELPSSQADYLQNPKPAYPPLSKRLGEQGKVMLRVLIGADGLPQKAEIAKSSGFDRLDQAAMAAVMKWRFVPGKRGGMPETAWAQVPIEFVLE